MSALHNGDACGLNKSSEMQQTADFHEAMVSFIAQDASNTSSRYSNYAIASLLKQLISNTSERSEPQIAI